MNIISGIYWDKGRQEQNQDSLLVEQVLTKRGRILLAVVSDGIGSLKEGGTASGFVIERMRQCFYQELLPLIRKKRSKKDIRKCFLRNIYMLNQTMNLYGKNRELKLGATVSLLFLWGKRGVFVHLGDSRIYRITKKGGRLLTKDHIDGQGRLLKCSGSFAYREPDICFFSLRKNQGFLLCTDGFYRHGEKSFEKEGLLPGDTESKEQIQRWLKQVALRALRNGETDNMSAVYLVCR